MKKKLLYLMLIVLGTLTLIGCGKEAGEKLAEQNKNSIIQFNPELITNNTLEVIEGYIYSTSIADYVTMEGQMDVKITAIECPDGKVWNGENEFSHLEMFETYDAAEEPYIIKFKELYTGDTNTLQVYCYTKEQAVEKGMIANVVPFTFKDFIVDGQMNIVEGNDYSYAFEDYLITETLDTIKLTSVYNYFSDEEISDWLLEDDSDRMWIFAGTPPEGTSPYTWTKLTITDTSCNYSQDLYINVYAKDADTTGVLLAPPLE